MFLQMFLSDYRGKKTVGNWYMYTTTHIKCEFVVFAYIVLPQGFYVFGIDNNIFEAKCFESVLLFNKS